MIKVFLADDHQLFIDGMKALLEREKDIIVVGEAVNGEEVLDKIPDTEPNVLVLDIEMPELDGIEVTKYVTKHHKELKVLVLTMHNKKDFIMELMRIGAAGYILKNKSKEELVFAIHNVFNGRPHYGLEVLNTATVVSRQTEEVGKLTNREKEILRELALGKTAKEIGHDLKIAESTVNTHRRNILKKLNLPNEKHLIRYAFKNGIVDL